MFRLGNRRNVKVMKSFKSQRPLEVTLNEAGVGEELRLTCGESNPRSHIDTRLDSLRP